MRPQPGDPLRAAVVLGALVLLALLNVAAFGYLNGPGFARDADGHWPLQRVDGGLAAIAAGDPVRNVRDRALYFHLHDAAAGAELVTYPDSPLNLERLDLIARLRVTVGDYDWQLAGPGAEALASDARTPLVIDDDGLRWWLAADTSGTESPDVLWHLVDGDDHFLVPPEQARALGVEGPG